MIKNKKGFTLMELLVAIAIMAILIGIAVPSYFKIIDHSKKVVAQTNAKVMYSSINILLMLNDTNDPDTFNILRWVKPGRTITYKGVKDNSVTVPTSKSHHDIAKRAIQNTMGGTTLEMGYRLSCAQDSSGNYAISKLEIFYKKPENAQITGSKPDFVLN